jgi:ABC-type transport system involved in multi-copper enzyme maturation permease subunit
MFDLRLIGAEVLKLRRRRGMLALVTAITLGAIVLAFTVMTIQHADNPAKYGPAGGLSSYRDAIEVLLVLTIVAGAIVGSTAGAQDIESGVFRDLVATGRSRIALFGARVTGAWAIIVPVAAIAAAAAGIGAVALKGSAVAPTASALVEGTAAVLGAGMVSSAVAVGLCALVGSRGPVIAIMLGFTLALAPVLASMTFLGDVRYALPNTALNNLAHTTKTLHTTIAVAIAVLAGWVAAAFAAGAWRTQTREI